VIDRQFIETDEAFWKGTERVWASITQYPPKRPLGTIRGHLLAALIGGSLATVLLLIEQIAS
jgi:hypothetical protein